MSVSGNWNDNAYKVVSKALNEEYWFPIHITSKRGFRVFDDSRQGSSEFKLPKRATKGSAGYDFFNNTGEDIIIKAHSSTKIPTNVSSFMLYGEVLLIYPRSSLGIKYTVRILNTIPVIDSDYSGEIIIALQNDSSEDVVIHKGSAFCQGVFLNHLLASDDDTSEERVQGTSGGIGSTGKI